MATVVLPRSLAAILPGAERRLAVADGSVATVIDELETRIPGVRNRLCDAGPTLRQHLNVFVDGQRADLDTRVEAGSTVHVIPAVSGGSRNRGREPNAGLDRFPFPTVVTMCARGNRSPDSAAFASTAERRCPR